MFKPEPMQHLALYALRADLPQLALELARQSDFCPDAPTAEDTLAQLEQLPGKSYRERYTSALVRYQKILAFCDGHPTPPPAQPEPVAEAELERLDAWLGEVWLECSRYQEQRRAIEEEQKRLRHLLSLLERFADLKLDLGLLARPNRFLDIEIGSLPTVNRVRLADALLMAGCLMQSFHVSAEVTHAVVVGPSGQRAQVRDLLRTAAWKTMELPPELLALPDAARRSLTARLHTADAEHARLVRQSEDVVGVHQARLAAAALTLAHAQPYARLAEEALHGHGGLAAITGWVPRRQAPALQQRLATALPGRTAIHLRDPRAEERLQVPSALRHPAWLRPFMPLLRNYGVPRYGEIDPTMPFALSFVIMFGAMFGDVGHGLVIALAALLLRRRFPRGAGLGLAVGGAAIVFGFAYGSVFGAEWMHPLWMSPMADPVRMLVLAVWWGVGFITLTATLAVYNRLMERRIAAALCDSAGLAGIAFYLTAVAVLAVWLRSGTLARGPALGALLALGVVMIYKWRQQQDRGPERLAVALIEGVGTISSYFSNTLSFMRVAAFSLNHVVLALAVFAVADSLGVLGHGIALIAGNAFIVVLEGGIVGIQVLRLEYYEGLTRFFNGDGREFRPLTLATAVAPGTA